MQISKGRKSSIGSLEELEQLFALLNRGATRHQVMRIYDISSKTYREWRRLFLGGVWKNGKQIELHFPQNDKPISIVQKVVRVGRLLEQYLNLIGKEAELPSVVLFTRAKLAYESLLFSALVGDVETMKILEQRILGCLLRLSGQESRAPLDAEALCSNKTNELANCDQEEQLTILHNASQLVIDLAEAYVRETAAKDNYVSELKRFRYWFSNNI